MRVQNLTKLLAAVGSLGLTGSLHAATTTIDFNSDPVPLGIYTEPAGATAGEWRAAGGVTGAAGDGYLSVTDARDSQRGVLIFKDLENGLIVKSFTFECDLRMGGGNDDPADGFSINYASVDDPVITGGAFAGMDDEANLPEEGTQTGLAIGFDTWQSALIGGVQDVVGISIRVNNRLIAQLPVPVAGTNVFLPTMPNPGAQGTAYLYDRNPYRNLATNDPNYRFSMQTGARSDVNGDGVINGADEIDQVPFIDPNTSLPDPNWYKWMSNLSWAKFRAEVADDGKLKLFWKGNEVTPAGGLVTGFTPIAGRLIFAARTGGNNQVHHVDNISLVTQPFTSAVVQTVSGNAGGVTITILDQATASLDTNTLVIKIGGNTITPSSVVHNDANLTTTIRYNASPLLPLGTNVVNIAFKDNLGFQTDVSRNVIVAAYATSTASLAVPAGSVNTATPGFTTRTHQLPIGRNQGDNNRIAQIERQLAGGYINPDTGAPYVSLSSPGPNADGSYTIPYINWSDAGGNFGNFNASGTGTLAVTDDPVPGILGAQDNYVTETVAYLEIPAGYYTFGFNSDDGFEVSLGNGLEDIFGQRLGAFDGGKGASDVLFDVYFPTAGTFPVRITYWEGGGDTAGAEFFYVDPVSGNKILVNDLAHGSIIKAYTTATTGRRPAVSRVSPEQDQHFVVPDAEVAAWIDDGDITVSSATLTVNGVAVTAAPVKTGSTTKIARPSSLTTLLPIGVNNATVVYSYTEGGSTVNVTNSWSFRVLSYGVIPPAFKVAASETSGGAAFLARAHQIHRRPGNTTQDQNDTFPGDANRLPRPEYLLAGAYYDLATGLPYPNVAVVNATDLTFEYDLYDFINFNSGLTGTAPDRTINAGNSGVITPEAGSMPGLPIVGAPANEQFSNGGLDNIAVEFSGLIELKAGSTILAFNSDDGFRASAGSDPHDTAGVLLGHFNGGRGNSGSPLPNPTQSEVPNPGNNTGNSVFSAVVQEDGIYPIRVLFWQGGGGVNAEFLVIDKGSSQASLVGITDVPWGVAVYQESTLQRAYALYPPSPTPWDNRIQQMRVGLPKFWGNSPNSGAAGDSGDIYNDADNRRHFATAEVGAVFTNAVGKTITMTVNGNPVTPSITTTDGKTAVAYRPPQNAPLPGGNNTATINYEGGSHTWTFIVQTYTNVPASLVRPVADAATATPGFLVKVAQSGAIRANTALAAEQQLAGTPANVATNNPARADGRYPVTYVNYNNNKQAGYTAGADVGNFETNALAAWPFPKIADIAFPGIANTNLTGVLGRENFTAEITAWLKFDQAGYYPFGINGDDGWAVHAAEAGVTNGTVLFTIDRGGGSADIPFSFTVPQAGLYPIRLLYYQGGGGANVELFHYDSDGMKHLVNDPNDANSIKAYYDLGGGSGDRPQITVTRTGNDLTITWTNGGELLSADSVSGPYNGTGDTDGSFTVTINPATPAKFYQVRK